MDPRAFGCSDGLVMDQHPHTANKNKADEATARYDRIYLSFQTLTEIEHPGPGKVQPLRSQIASTLDHEFDQHLSMRGLLIRRGRPMRGCAGFNGLTWLR